MMALVTWQPYAHSSIALNRFRLLSCREEQSDIFWVGAESMNWTLSKCPDNSTLPLDCFQLRKRPCAYKHITTKLINPNPSRHLKKQPEIRKLLVGCGTFLVHAKFRSPPLTLTDGWVAQTAHVITSYMSLKKTEPSTLGQVWVVPWKWWFIPSSKSWFAGYEEIIDGRLFAGHI